MNTTLVTSLLSITMLPLIMLVVSLLFPIAPVLTATFYSILVCWAGLGIVATIAGIITCIVAIVKR